MKNSLKLFLLLLFVPVYFLIAQNTKETKACCRSIKSFTHRSWQVRIRQLNRAVLNNSVRYDGDISSAAFQVH